jgi:hypothetical protein
MKNLIIDLVVFFLICPAAWSQFDPNDFAVSVVEYVSGSNPVPGFTEPNMALGHPSVDTSYGFPVEASAVVPVFPAWQDALSVKQLVSIGSGGRIILQFGREVEDDVNNPYGIDFIVFGNSFFSATSSWSNGDPGAISIASGLSTSEPGRVSVAQEDPNDPNSWYTYAGGPFADGYAGTLGRIYDPNEVDSELGPGNLWWSGPTNPTKPLDPSLLPADFAGKTVAQVAEIFGVSAGGTGFDLAESGFSWIRYVRIENVNSAESAISPEIDAVADVDAGYCGDFWHPYPPGDINLDCHVGLLDFSLMTNYWLASTWTW